MPLAACVRAASEVPAWLGRNPSSSTAASTFARVASDTGADPRRARETVAIPTPARAATS